MKLWCVTYLTFTFSFNAARNQKERLMAMYQLRNIHGHIQVYDYKGNFLFSADSEREAREELMEYEESAA